MLQHYFSGAIWPNRTRTFLELGAFDGWQESNTLHLEACRGWRGVLIDGNPTHLDWMRVNRPAALSIGAAVCSEHGRVAYSRQNATTDGILEHMSPSLQRRFRVQGAGRQSVPCGPLAAWVRLVGLSHVDFFSLDVRASRDICARRTEQHFLQASTVCPACAARVCARSKALSSSCCAPLTGRRSVLACSSVSVSESDAPALRTRR